MDCNADDEEEKSNMIVCSWTRSKVAEYREVLRAKHPGKWWRQADNMFPVEFIPHESGVSNSNNEKMGTLERELAKLLVVTVA